MTALLALLLVQQPIVVQPAGPVRTLGAALALAPRGGRIVVRAGSYREPTIIVARPVEIVGEGGPVFLGGPYHTLEVRADSVLIRGLVFEAVPPATNEDRAAILVTGASGCRIESNELRDAFFGIYLKEARNCRVTGNRVAGAPRGPGASGNGIHLWRVRDALIADNLVTGHRDGVYLEFSPKVTVRGNTVRGNLRYGLHFMRSDSCHYERNSFLRNGAGVAVMYSRSVRMIANRFEHNWGAAAYGLLLKDISDATVQGNRFLANSTGLYLEGSERNRIVQNRFEQNGWAVRLLASAPDNRFEGNSFSGNSFDVSTNSRTARSDFRGNWWDRYRGYDLDRDGYGDVPFLPVRLFSLVVEQSKPAIVLLRSPFIDLLDSAERLLPILTPRTLADPQPLLRRPS